MADLTYQVNVDTAAARNSLQGLQNSIKGVNDSFGALNKVLAGFAAGAFVASAYNMANALSDISSASGIALANILGFTQAVAANGGSIDGATASIGRFSKFINDAAQGNKNAQSTLMDLGISLEELRTLSEQDLLRRTIQGLSNMEAGARRTSTQIEIFGKTFASVDFAGVNRGIDGFIQRAGPSADSIRAAGEAQQNFAAAIKTLQIEVLAALAPISRLANAILESTDAVAAFIKAIVQIGIVVATFTIVGRAVAIVGGAFRLLSAGVAEAGGIMTIVGNAFRNFQLIIKNIVESGNILGTTLRVLKTELGNVLQWLLKNIPGLTALGVAFGFLGDWIKKGVGALKEWIGASENESATWDKIMENRAKDIEARKKQEEEIRKVTSAVEAESQALQKQVTAYQASTAAATKKYELDTALINASERQRLATEELQAAETAYLSAIAPLLEEYAKRKDSLNKVDQAVLPEITKKLQELTATYEQQVGVIQRNTAARAAANEAKAFEQYLIQQTQRDYDELMKVENELVRGPMTAIERKYYDIMDAADASARAAIRAEEARRGAPLSASEVARYYETARQGANKLFDANKRLTEQQRSFSYGWNKAFKEYVDGATNAAKQAERMFEKFTQGLEDLIVNFAKTGKFEWKSFVNSMLEELLRSQIKQTIAGFFKMENPFSNSGGTIGDLFGGIFGALGGGEIGTSPNNPMYVMDISGGGGGGFGGMFGGQGQQGGGFFNTIGNLFSGIKNIGSNIFSGIGNTVSSVVKTVSNIGSGLWDTVKNVGSSIVSGIGSLFGGFFANGGTLPAGKFGIAGESGPELITGPAQITPMSAFGGGTTQVVYNINAVDARSFQQLLSQDPSFIFALTEQGRKSFAGGR